MTRHVPGPSLYAAHERTGEMVRNFGPYKDYRVFCERLRVVLVKNIDTTAVILKKYFVDPSTSTSTENGDKSQNGH